MSLSPKPLSILLSGALALAACGGKTDGAGGSSMEMKNPDTYVQVTFGEIDSLDPAWSYDTGSHEIILQVYEPLISYKGSSLTEFEPLVASKVPTTQNGLISKDGRSYRFPIRKGLKFHDGKDLTPDDVRYSIMRFCLQDRDGGPSELLTAHLAGAYSTRKDGKPDPAVFKALEQAVRVEGDDVVLTLKKPFAPFLSILASWAPVVSRQWAKENGDWDGTEATWTKFNNPQKQTSPFYAKVNGSGPFMLERWNKETREIALTRFDGYWRGPAKLKRAIIKSVDEFATRKLMLSAGDADTITADRRVFPDVSKIPGVTVIDDLPTVDMNPIVFFTFKINPTANANIGSGKLDGEGIPADFFSDKDVRLAFAHAFDYDGYIRDVSRGKGVRARGCIPKALDGHDPEAPVYPFDPAKVAEHLKKAWGGQVWEKGFKFNITYNTGNDPRMIMAQMFKREIEKVNPKFKIDVRGVQWASFLQDMTAKKLPIFVMGWAADYPDAHNFAQPLLHSKGQYATTQGFADAKIDELIEKAAGELDPAKRRKLYAEMERRAYEIVPQLYVINGVSYRNHRDWVKGYVHNPIFPSSPYGTYLYNLSKSTMAAAETAPAAPAGASR